MHATPIPGTQDGARNPFVSPDGQWIGFWAQGQIGDTGAGMYACKASVDMFGLTKDDFVDQIQDIITVGEFYQKAAGWQIIFN